MIFVEGLGIFGCISVLMCSLVMWYKEFHWKIPCLPKKSRVLEIHVPSELSRDEVEEYVDSKLKLMANSGDTCALDIINGYVQLKFD